jgi:pimeloyl-ACP methyl ester carboxylesterase
MKEVFVSHINLQLCVQTFGEIKNPAVVLIVGAAGQAILWPRKFCENLALEGYFVIRYDHRDTGLSSAIDFELSPYNLQDMAGDVVGILDHFKIKQAHIIGMSMGGYIAQNLAIYYPNRIISTTLFMTTINSMAMRGVRGIDNLPGQDPGVAKEFAKLYQTPRVTLEDRLNTLIRTWELFNGAMVKFSYDEWYPIAENSYQRAKTKSAVRNHRLAVLNSPADRTQILKEIVLPPTLIIHGQADPIVQVDHALYAHKHLPQTKLVIIKEMGHLFSSLFIDQVLDVVLEHFLKIRRKESELEDD